MAKTRPPPQKANTVQLKASAQVRNKVVIGGKVCLFETSAGLIACHPSFKYQSH